MVGPLPHCWGPGRLDNLVLVNPESAKGHISNISHLIFLDRLSLFQKVVGKTLNFGQASTTDSPTQLENTHHKEQLPETGESSNPLLFLAGLSVVLTSIFLLKNKID